MSAQVETSVPRSGAYLSWKVMVGLLREEREVWWQMRDDIICISNSNRVRQVSLEVRSKSSIAAARLPKCHQLHIFQPVVHLKRTTQIPLAVQVKPSGKKEAANN